MIKFTLETVRFESTTASPAVPDQPVAEDRPLGPRHTAHQICFDIFRRTLFGKTEPLGKPLDVSVDDDAFGSAEGIAENNVCSLAADSRKSGEFRERARDFSVVRTEQSQCTALEVLGFGAKKSGGLDDGLQFGLWNVGVILGGPAAFKKDAGHLVDSNIGALGGEDGSHEQLERVAEQEFAMRVRVGLREDL